MRWSSVGSRSVSISNQRFHFRIVTMTRLIMRSIMRAGRLIENPLSMNGAYRVPRRGDGRNDFHHVVGDMKTISHDLRSTAREEPKKYGR